LYLGGPERNLNRLAAHFGLHDSGDHRGAAVGSTYDPRVIFITAKFVVRPEHADAWPDLTRAFTEATRNEPGCLWFDWSRSLDDPTEYVLVEAFRDGDAGAAHVQSDHFAAATSALPQYLAETPRIVSQTVDQEGWSELGEMQVD
jgi:quinol monooxygenase YgiN